MNPSEPAYMQATRPHEWRNEPMCGKPPLALYVCRESRRVALRNGYEVAFKGWRAKREGPFEYDWQKNLEGEDLDFWERDVLDEKGIWVNFDRDVIMFDALWRESMYPKCSEQNLLLLLKRYTPDEANRIQGLALGAMYRPMLSLLRGEAVSDPSQDKTCKWQLYGFDFLRDIWIDDEFEAEEIGHEEYYKDAVRMSRVASYPVPAFKFWDAANAKRDFWIKMQHVRPRHFASWQAVLPDVRVVRGMGWKKYF